MNLIDFVKAFPDDSAFTMQPRPYFNHSVAFKRSVTAQERADILEKAGLNVFFFPSEMITGCDLLSDSGVTTMTDEQWAGLHMGDEAYGSNRGYFMLIAQVREVFGEGFFNEPGAGKPNAFIFHQGRPSEDALFSEIGKVGTGLVIPSNGHFDTTQANIQAHNIRPENLFSPELNRAGSSFHFKGNMDVERFRALLKRERRRIPLVYLTITNNTGGGQPVSMANIKAVSELCVQNDIPLFFDACRFAENAWFIWHYEEGYAEKSIREIVREMFTYVDGFTISFKKDGLVNMGGGLFLKNEGLCMKKYPHIPDALIDYQIIKEGHPTYGGMSGRDIMALSIGLGLVTRKEYLSYRINQVQDFGKTMSSLGLPVLMPPGGHAVYIDVNKFFEGTALQPGDFGGVALCALLLAAYGHRACELGYFAFGSYNAETHEDSFPEMNFVRCAVPRLRYEKQDLDSVCAAIKALYDNRHHIPGVEVVYGRDLSLRHFKARFKFKT
jgi:tryptophanase